MMITVAVFTSFFLMTLGNGLPLSDLPVSDSDRDIELCLKILMLASFPKDDAIADETKPKRGLLPKPLPFLNKLPGNDFKLSHRIKYLLSLITQKMRQNKINLGYLKQFLDGSVKVQRVESPPMPPYYYRYPLRRFGRY